MSRLSEFAIISQWIARLDFFAD